MRLTHLCDVELISEGRPVLVRPYGSEEGAAYGQGSGTLDGARLRGTLRWVNHPHRRSDGAMLPDLRGVVTTADDTAILLSMQGRTVWIETPQGIVGNQLLCVLFETVDERYRWLNDAVCVSEGKVTMRDGRPTQLGVTRIYVCENEAL
jgi:Protein of unknown function (DUF3237)